METFCFEIDLNWKWEKVSTVVEHCVCTKRETNLFVLLFVFVHIEWMTWHCLLVVIFFVVRSVDSIVAGERESIFFTFLLSYDLNKLSHFTKLIAFRDHLSEFHIKKFLFFRVNWSGIQSSKAKGHFKCKSCGCVNWYGFCVMIEFLCLFETSEI